MNFNFSYIYMSVYFNGLKLNLKKIKLIIYA